MNVKAGDLAIVVKGLWPNVGRIVYVDRYRPLFDFSPMGLPPSPGWRVRSISAQPLETIEGLRMVGITPVRSLRRIVPLPPDQMHQIAQRMAVADCREAMDELAEIMETIEQEAAVEVER